MATLIPQKIRHLRLSKTYNFSKIAANVLEIVYLQPQIGIRLIIKNRMGKKKLEPICKKVTVFVFKL